VKDKVILESRLYEIGNHVELFAGRMSSLLTERSELAGFRQARGKNPFLPGQQAFRLVRTPCAAAAWRVGRMSQRVRPPAGAMMNSA
jgi:hypothetical protein